MKQIALVLCCIFSLNLSAQWNKESSSHAYSLDAKKAHGFTDGGQATLWGAIKGKVTNLHSVKTRHIKAGSLKSFEKGVNILFHKQSKNFTTLKRPLMVILPGIYSNIYGYLAIEPYTRFKNMGYHVIAMSNPWSKAYVKDRSVFLPGDVENEAFAALEVSQFAIDKLIGANKVSTVNVYGSSYGGFLAAVMANVDVEKGFNIINGSITTFSAPINIKTAVNSIDQLGQKHKVAYKKLGLVSSAKVALDYVFAKNQKDLSSFSIKNSETLMAYRGFSKRFQEFLSYYTKDRGISYLPSNRVRHYGDSELYRYHLEQQRAYTEAVVDSKVFDDYFNDLAPELLEDFNSVKSDFIYWLTKARYKGVNIRAITADDDFLNAEYNKEPNQNPFRQFVMDIKTNDRENPYLIIVKYGGHLGFMEFDWFDKLIDLSFPKYKTSSDPDFNYIN